MFIVCPRNKQRHRSVELNLWMAWEELFLHCGIKEPIWVVIKIS